jgi:hypothetical protein
VAKESRWRADGSEGIIPTRGSCGSLLVLGDGARRRGRLERFSPTLREKPSLGRRFSTGWACVGLAVTLMLLPTSASAFGETSAVTFGIVRHGGRSGSRASGYKRLSWEVSKRTSIAVVLEPKVVDLSDPDLFLLPLLVLSGEGDFPPFGEAEREALRRHLTFGGLLIVDDESGQPGGPFDRAARRELAAVFPTAKPAKIDKAHVLYKSFYLLEKPFGRVEAATEADGITLAGRLAVLFSPNDLGGALAKDGFGNWEHEVVPGGDQQRERAFRFGVNVVMYALCLDYKDDQVHVPFIMKRRR